MTDDAPLRILHTEASLGWGGQEIRVLSEAAALAARGHKVHLACDPRSDIFAAAPRYGIAATAIVMRKRPASLLALRRLFAEFRPDVVNVHSSIDHWLTAVGRIGLSPRPAVVKTRHISAPVGRNQPTRWLYNSGADFVMTTGDAITAQLTGDGFLPSERVASVPTGIDSDRYAPGRSERGRLGLPERRFVFGIVATLRSWKGHSHLIDALASVARTHDVHLAIVGDGPQEANLREQVGRLGLVDRVTFTGRIDDVVPHLHALDAFVLSSYANEGVPQALLQAMACRLPCIACPVGGIPELTEGLAGVRRPEPRNAEALAGAMRGAVDAPASDAARDALRQRVVSSYSTAIMAEKALAAFRKAMANR